MTLNLMLSSRSGVFLSGDFRLSFLDKGGRPTGRFSDDTQTQKLIPVIKFGWNALVAFTGVASRSHIPDVGEWIATELQAIPMKAGFDELPIRLLAADEWLKDVLDDRR